MEEVESIREEDSLSKEVAVSIASCIAPMLPAGSDSVTISAASKSLLQKKPPFPWMHVPPQHVSLPGWHE